MKTGSKIKRPQGGWGEQRPIVTALRIDFAELRYRRSSRGKPIPPPRSGTIQDTHSGDFPSTTLGEEGLGVLQASEAVLEGVGALRGYCNFHHCAS
jgi:hypothetical protein